MSAPASTTTEARATVAPRRRRPRGPRSARAVAAIGALLLVGPLVGDGVGRAQAGERLVTGARPAVGRPGIERLRAHTDLVIATGGAILNEAVPALAVRLGAEPAAFATVIDEQFPALAEADRRKKELGTALDATVTNLERRSGDFADADAIPVGGVHPVVLPIAAMVLGGVLLAFGFLARGGRRRVAAGITTAGLLMVLGPLATGLPGKAAAAERVLDSLTTTEENATRTREQFDLTVRAADEVRTGLLPAAAAALGTTSEALLADLRRDIAALDGIDGLDEALADIERDVEFREDRLGDFALVHPVPLQAVTWVFVGLGAVVVLCGVHLARRRPTAG